MNSLRAQLILKTLLGITLFLALGSLAIYEIVNVSMRRDMDRSLLALVRSSGAAVGQEIDKRLHQGRELGLEAFDVPVALDEEYQIQVDELGVIDRSLGVIGADFIALASELEEPVLASVALPDGSTARAVSIRLESAREERPGGAGPGPEGRPREDRPPFDRGRRPPPEGRLGRRGPLFDPSPPFELTIARRTGPLDDRLAQLRLLLLASWALACAGCGLILFVAVKRGLKPLDRLRSQIESMDETGLDRRFDIAGAPEELVPVIDQLDDFVRRIGSAFEREQAFSAHAAHELRTPIAGLRSTLELALRRERKPAEYRAAVEQCLDITQQMQSMVEQLLDLASPPTEDELREIRLARAAERAWALCAAEAESRHVNLASNIAPDLAATTQPVLFERILGNLLENAAHYADEDSTVTLDATANGDVTLQVTNAASSAPPDVADRAFDVFWRADKSRTGAGRHVGLGLSLSRRLAELLGGSLEAHYADGSFLARLTLPRE